MQKEEKSRPLIGFYFLVFFSSYFDFWILGFDEISFVWEFLLYIWNENGNRFEQRRRGDKRDLSTPYTKIDQSQWEFVFYARNQSQKRRRSERNTVNFTILPPSSSSSSSAAAARWTSNEFMNGGAERVKRVIEFVFFSTKKKYCCYCVFVYVWKCIKLNWECFHYSGSRRSDYSTTAIYLFRCCSVCLLCCLVHRARIVLVCLAHRKWATRKSERVRRKSIWNDDDKRCSKRGNRMRKKDTKT